jgi:quinoprotein glucose dehydrogenase
MSNVSALIPTYFLRLILIGAAVASSSTAQSASAPGEWLSYGGEKSFDRYSPLAQINRGNVSKLGIVWARPAVDPVIKDKYPDVSPSTYFRSTPIMVNGTLYAPNGVGLVEAFDAATGITKWVQQPLELDGSLA